MGNVTSTVSLEMSTMSYHAAPTRTILTSFVAFSILVCTVRCKTLPDQVDGLFAIRDSLIGKSEGWAKALESWTCPTDPNDSEGSCDPCSKDWSGNFEHIQCRGADGPYGEGSVGVVDGYVTTVHITDQHIGGPAPSSFCSLTKLRELDLDGGDFSGPFPEWIQSSTCLPGLQELDFSYNRFTGVLPAAISSKTLLQEIKVEQNQFIGRIPSEYGNMPALRVFRAAYNHLTGPIPATFSNLSKLLNNFDVGFNRLTGDLKPLVGGHLMQVTVHYNPDLCGMVPHSVRFANGFNPAGTRLGSPC